MTLPQAEPDISVGKFIVGRAQLNTEELHTKGGEDTTTRRVDKFFVSRDTNFERAFSLFVLYNKVVTIRSNSPHELGETR